MTATFDATAHGPRHALRMPSRAVLSGAFALVAALALSAVAATQVPRGWVGRTAAEPVPASDPDDVPTAAVAEGKARARFRCPTCGVVESIVQVDHGAALPPTFEFTVRLRDGSLRTSTAAHAANWRTGDRIMLIGSTGAASAH